MALKVARLLLFSCVFCTAQAASPEEHLAAGNQTPGTGPRQEAEKTFPEGLRAGDSSELSSERLRSRAAELNRLGERLHQQGKLKEAEARFRDALKVWDPSKGPAEQGLIVTLNGLANTLRMQGDYSKSESLLRRAIAAGEKLGKPAQLDLAFSLNSLGALYCDQRKPSRAVLLMERALRIRESVLGPNHPQLAASWNNLASVLVQRHRLDEAEVLCRRSLDVLASPGEDHYLAAVTTYNLAELCFRGSKPRARLPEAEDFYKRSMAYLEGTIWSNHPQMALALRGLAELYLAQRRYSEAEPLLFHALALQEKAAGPHHPEVAKVLFQYAELLRKTNKRKEAAAIERRAKAATKSFEAQHPGQGATIDFSTLQKPR